MNYDFSVFLWGTVSYFSYIPKMKKTSFIYSSDVFDKSHFLVEDDSDIPSGTHRHYSFTGYLDGVNRRAWAMAGIQNK